MTKTILQGTVRGTRRRGRQRKRWEDNIKEWTGLDFPETQRAADDRKKRKGGSGDSCKVIGGAPMTLWVTGLMMMMEDGRKDQGEWGTTEYNFTATVRTEEGG